ncbi:hypothetical protein CH296_26715 [Rhodococcus sp. 14-2496-1d]|nr:hypothetical protein CH296_26715 [Rhodococcus sp. 14-2496-1d]
MPPYEQSYGIAPVRACIEQAVSQVLSRDINPGRVFDKTVTDDNVSSGYAAMDAREALKVLIEF